MKPPRGNRPGGSGRPPPERGPFQGGGASQRPFGQRPSGPGGSGHHASGQRSNQPHQDGQRAQGGGFYQGQGRGGPGEPNHRQAQGQRPQGERQGKPQGKPQGNLGQGYQPRPQGQHGGPHGQPQRFGGGRPSHQQSHQQGQHERHGPDAPRGAVWLYGHHAVAAALANPSRRLRRLLLTEEAEAAITQQLPPPWALATERVDRGRLDHLLGRDVVHQGAALLADPLATPSLQSVLDKPGTIVVLDQVSDPRNVGAILRSAAAFGAAAVVTQDRNAPEETGALAKAASGALETMPLLRAVNIARTLIALKAANIWCVGLDAAGPPLSGPSFGERRVALVLGAEGEGLRRLTRETCDEVAGLAIKGAVESLNVSAAAAVALYELTRRQ